MSSNRSGEAENLATQAQSFFNFLLNRYLQSPIELVARRRTTRGAERSRARTALVDGAGSPSGNRAGRTAAPRERRADAYCSQQKWPTLSLGVDAGTQGEDYRFGDGYNFGMRLADFHLAPFDGGGDSARVHQARAAEKQLVLRQEEIAQQIRLEVQQSLRSTHHRARFAGNGRGSIGRSSRSLRIASRKRDEGVISQVEFIDARSALTSAELNHNLTCFQRARAPRQSWNTRPRRETSRSIQESDHAAPVQCSAPTAAVG